MALITPDDHPVPDVFQEVEAVTPADVARVARDYLSRDKRYQAVHRPGLTPATLVRPLLVSAGVTAAGIGAWLVARLRRNGHQD